MKKVGGRIVPDEIIYNEHIGYVCPYCGEFYEFDECEAMRCCGANNYLCRYKRLSDGAEFNLDS